MERDVKSMVKPHVFGLEKYVPGEYREGFIKLASNENNYGPSPKVVNAIMENAGRVHVYPFLDAEVKKLAAKYAGVGVDSVMMGNGSDELMELVLKTFNGPVAAVYPSYASYRIFPRMLGMEFFDVGLLPDFTWDVDDFIAKSKRANLYFIGNPNNPTGNLVEEEDLVRLLDEGKIVVLDEAYTEFSGGTHIKLTGEYDNLLVLRTLSKAFGIGGLRVGYMVGNPETVSYVNHLKPPFSIALLAEFAAMRY